MPCNFHTDKASKACLVPLTYYFVTFLIYAGKSIFERERESVMRTKGGDVERKREKLPTQAAAKGFSALQMPWVHQLKNVCTHIQVILLCGEEMKVGKYKM